MLLTFRITKGLFFTYYFSIRQQDYRIVTYYKPTEIGCENEWFIINLYHTKIKRNYPNIRKTFKELKFIYEH
jgi:hypothetical protein